MKIFITGGSGFIGTNLVSYFLNLNWEVVNYDIREPQNPDHRPYWIEGDILDYSHYSKQVKTFSPDYFVHLAARTDILENKDLINGYAENIKGVEHTIAIIRQTESLKRVLFASSRMVCKIDHVPENEDDYCPPNLYGLSKVIGERLVKTAHLNCEWSIFRPTSIWGEWFDSPYIIFFRTIQKGFYFNISGYNPFKSFGYIGNSVYQIHKLLMADQALIQSKTFYLCDYPPLFVNEWANLINQQIGKRKIWTVPFAILKPVAMIGDRLLKMGWNRVPITSFRLSNLISNMEYDTQSLQEICGALPFSLEQGVLNTTQWMQHHKNRDKLAGRKMN